MKRKEIPWIIGLLTVLHAVVLIMHRDTVLIFQDDCLTQLNTFIQNITTYPNWLKWDWNSFLGAPYLASNSFYYATNVIVLVLVPVLKILGEFSFFFLNYIFLILLSLTTSYWLSNHVSDWKARFVGISIIVFSGWTMAFYKYHFLSVFWVLPVILFCIDFYFKNGKGYLLALSIAFCGLTNYYFLIIFTPFIFLYTLFIYFYNYQQNDTVIETVKKAGMFFVYYFLGVGISGVVFVPSILQILKAPRNVSTDLFQFLNWQQGYRLITGLFNPINAVNEHNYFISSSYQDSLLTYGGGPVVYSLLVTLMMFPQIRNLKKEKRNNILVLYAFIVVLVMLPGIYPLLNANWDSRWMFMIVYFNAFVVSQVMDNKKYCNKTALLNTVLWIVIIFVCLMVTYKLNLYPSFEQFKVLLIYMMGTIVLLVGYAILMIRFNSKLWLLVMIEAVISFSAIFSFNSVKGSWSQIISKEDYESKVGIAEKVVAGIEDKENYRINEISKDSYAVNSGVANEYMSFTLYSSLYNFNVEEFADGRFKGYGQWKFLPNMGLNSLKNTLASKYVVNYKNSCMVPYDYRFYKQVNGIDVYINNHPLSLGYAVDYELSEDTFDSLSYFDQNRVLLNTVITDQTDNSEVHFVNHPQAILVDQFGSTLINVEDYSTGVLYIKENADYNYLIPRGYELYGDHQLIEESKLETDFPLELSLNEKIDEIYVHVFSEDLLGYNITYDVYYDDMSWYNEWIESLQDESFKNVVLTDNSLSAQITLQNEKWVLMSIAYDDGWKAYADGVEVELYKVNGGLMAMVLPEGTHTIEMKFVPAGIQLGFIVSLASISVLLGLFLINRRNKHEVE